MNVRTLVMSVSIAVAGLSLVQAAEARGYRSNSSYGRGVSGGYLSPNGPSSRANQYKVPFYMRADRRVLGMYP